MNKNPNQVKIIAHVSLSLKSFNMSVEAYSNSTLLGDLQAIYKNKKYYFHIVNNLSVEDIKQEKFSQTVNWCEKNNANFIVVTKSWDKKLDAFVSTDDYLWKILPMDKLAQIGNDFLERKYEEKQMKKIG